MMANSETVELKLLHRRAYALMVVLFIAGLGAILSLSYLAAHRNVLEESAHDNLMTRASTAAELALELAIHELVENDGYPAWSVQDYQDKLLELGDEAQTLELVWDDHWGVEGVLGVVAQYDSGPMSSANVDLYALQVRRFEDVDEQGASQFNFATSYYKISVAGYARSGSGLGARSARHRMEAVVQIPKDSYFSNLIGDNSYSEPIRPFVNPPVVAVVALDPVDTEGEPPDEEMGAPLYIGNGVYIEGSIYSRRAPNIHGYVAGHVHYEDVTVHGGADPPVPPELLNGDYISMPADFMIAPTLTLEDYVNPVNKTYLIDEVRRKAQPLADVVETTPGVEGVFTADDDVEVLGGSSKTNPANVRYYDGDVLIIDSVSSQVFCTGTIVAKTIELHTSGTPPDEGYSFHFKPAIEGFPSMVCNELRLGGPGNANNTHYEKTFLEGPALIRQYIYSNYNMDQPNNSDHRGGAVFYGYIVSNRTGAELPGEEGFAAQGFYHGPCNTTGCGDWGHAWTGFVVDEEANPVYVLAQDASNRAVPYRRLQLINGQSVSGATEMGRGIFTPQSVKFIRTRRNEPDIHFSDAVEAQWLDCIAGTLEECQTE